MNTPRQIMVAIFGALCLLLAGCGSDDGGQSPDSVVSASMTSQAADASREATPLPASEATYTAQPQASSTGALVDRTVIQRAVINDLAKYFNVTVEQIKLIETSERTWLDPGLGCNIRQGVFEPAPTPGFLITLQHNNETYAYHTDTQGRFVRCVDAGKPLGPITR